MVRVFRHCDQVRACFSANVKMAKSRIFCLILSSASWALTVIIVGESCAVDVGLLGGLGGRLGPRSSPLDSRFFATIW